MCGRFANSKTPAEIQRLFRTTNPTPNFQPSWNIAPSQAVPVIRLNPESGQRSMDLLSWGLVPHWVKDLKAERKPINARAETVMTSPMCRGAYAARRCLVPADAFYEWRQAGPGQVKQPFAIARQDGQPLVFAGLWEGWRSPGDLKVIRSFAVITTSANADIAPVHDRMPVILEETSWPTWLGEVSGDPVGLMRPAADGTLELWKVGTAVNSPRNNNASLLERIT
jgi:putative SOS response-associated peptidase YedK